MCVRTSVTVFFKLFPFCKGKARAFYGELACFRGRDKIVSWILKIAPLSSSAHWDNYRV